MPISDVESFLNKILYDIAKEKGFTVQDVEVDLEDHVHLFVSAPPKLSPSYIVKMFKGISGKRLFIQFLKIKKLLWKGRLWNSGSYIETVCSVSEEAIKQYVKNRG